MSNKKPPAHSAAGMFDKFASNPGVLQTGVVERMYRRVLTEWATTRFKWEGLPDSVDHRFLEMQLYYQGMILFYKDKRYDKYIAVRGMIQGPMNYNDNPTSFRTLGIANYQGIALTAKNCVPVWASYTRVPAHDIVLLYAKRLADIDKSLEINAKNMRQNKVVTAEDGQRLTMTNLVRGVDEGSVIYATPGMIKEGLSTLDLGVNPANLSALRQEKNQVWNECMTLLGITNSNQDKKERLVAAEATGSDGQVMAARNSEMKPRQEACERINKLFPDLNLSVAWDLDPEPVEGEEGESEQLDSMREDSKDKERV